MTGPGPRVSVVVVSRDRPALLMRCLRGLSLVRYPWFEIIVVSCPLGMARLAAEGYGPRIKAIAFDEPNISAARNLGIERAAGEVVAFLDDDAVPEPMWLDHLAEALRAPEVVAAGGFTHARNGIEIATRGSAVTPEARETPVALDEDAPTVLTPGPDRGIKIEGTNMAFRREILARLGGFDPAYRFYLDETDLALRLARAEAGRVAIVPAARMHHGSAPSARRRGDKVALSLHEVGASLSVFLRRHAPDDDPETRVSEERQIRRATLLRHLVAGRVEPRDVDRILATFDDGVDEGQTRPLRDLDTLAEASAEFLRFVPDPPHLGPKVLTGRWSERRALRAEAENLARRGHLVSVYLVSRSTLYHRVSFTAAGVWEQRGGLWGRSLRSDPLVRPWRFRGRITREIGRTLGIRGPMPET